MKSLGLFFFFLGVFILFRSFEEGSQSKATTTTTTTSPVISSKNPQGPFVRIWPGSHEDAGVLILSDSDSDDDNESDGD